MNRRKAMKSLGAFGLGSLTVTKPIEAKSPFKLLKRFEKNDHLSFQRLNELVDAINDLKKQQS